MVMMAFLIMQDKLMVDPGQDLDQVLANKVAATLMHKGHTMATAESCTGGAIGALLTSLAGSSRWFNGGVISYSNLLKKIKSLLLKNQRLSKRKL